MHKGEWVECTERGEEETFEEGPKKCDFFCRQLLEAATGKMLKISQSGYLYEKDLKRKKKKAVCMGCLKVCMHS